MPIESKGSIVTPPLPAQMTRRMSLIGIFSAMFTQTVADGYAEDRLEGQQASPVAQVARIGPVVAGFAMISAGKALTAHSEAAFTARVNEAKPPPPFQDRPPGSEEELRHEIESYMQSSAGVISEQAQKNAHLLRRSFYGKMLAEAGRAFTFAAGFKMIIDSFVYNVERARRNLPREKVK